MLDLFGDEGLAALRGLARQRTLYAFDYDGTLSPIVARPDDAYASASTIALLERLGRQVPTLLLTGRSADDLRARIAFTPTYLVGNHGAEGLPAELADLDGLAAHRAVVDRWFAHWPRLDDERIIVERKTYSLSIHYRLASDHHAARAAIGRAIGQLDPSPRVIGGKCVFNLLPPGAPDKGQALAALVAFDRCTSAFFIGDDVTDEAAFVDAPPAWVTVRVGRDEQSAARFYIADQDAIDRCLRTLIDAVETS